MKKLLCLLIFSALYLTSYSQESLLDTLSSQSNTVVKKSIVDKVLGLKSNISQEIKNINTEQINNVSKNTPSDVLMNTGSIYVRNIFQGGGSPIIRGFEGNRIGLYVDGVRLNNLIYSSNYVQNSLSIDPSLLNEIEVLNGPSSTTYGSDAMGGILHFKTKMPELAVDTFGSKLFKGNVFAKYNSANKGQTYHADITIGNPRFSSLTSASYTSFDNLKMGNASNPFSNTMYGRNFYVDTLNGIDKTVKNNENLFQKNSNYNQYFLVQKFVIHPDEFVTHNINLQFNQTSVIPNFAQLTELKKNKPRFAESNYGPQNRFLAAYDVNSAPDSAFFTSVHVGVNMQDVKEELSNRYFNSQELFTYKDHIQIIGASLDFVNEFTKHTVKYGIDGNYNNLTSDASQRTSSDTTIYKTQNAHPSNGSTAYNIGAYASHTWNINDKLILNDGLRIGYHNLNSKFNNEQTNYYHINIGKEVVQQMPVYSINAGLVYKPTTTLKINALLSTGYRVPNVTDLSFIYSSTLGKVIVPNVNIKPELIYNLDLGATYFYNEKIWIENTVFASYLKDALVLSEATYNGDNKIEYSQFKNKGGANYMSKVFMQQNMQEAIMYGLSSNVFFSIFKYWQINASVNYTYGKIIKPNAEPMSHIPPVFAILTTRYQKEKLSILFSANFNGTKSLSNYGRSFTEYAMYATPNGTPTWFTLNLIANYTINHHWLIQAGIDNILDTQYRTYGSGINASGRNAFAILKFNW